MAETPSSPNIQRSLGALAGPMVIENLLRLVLMLVELLILNDFNGQAVAAVGLIDQFLWFLQILYLTIATGTGILLSQYLGSKRQEDAEMAMLASYGLVVVFGLILGLVLSVTASSIVGLYGLAPQVRDYASTFLTINAAGSIFLALSMVQGTVLRAHGHTKSPMVVNIVVDAVSLVATYVVLYGPFGLPVLGVAGFASAKIVTQAAGTVVLGIILHSHKEIVCRLHKLTSVGAEVYRRILRVGIPPAGEMLSFSLSQMVIMRAITLLGTNALLAFVYVERITSFVTMATMAIGSAGQIKIGWMVGAGKFDLAARRGFQYYGLGMVVSTVLILVVVLFRNPLLAFFTTNSDVLALGASLLVVSIFRETGRVANIVVIPALNGAGDVHFPVISGLFFVWGIAVPGSWLLGITLGWGMIGIWIALSADEWLRGLLMVHRWATGRWKSKALIRAT